LNPNLLVLDEPTNHLDMASREALADVLKNYEGTLILISHDRWLLGAVTNNTLDIRRNQTIQFGGSYSEYREFQSKKTPASVATKVEVVVDTKPALSPREVSKAIQKAQQLIEQAEALVAKKEKELSDLEAKLANLSANDDVVALSTRHQSLQGELASAMTQWESRCLELEEFEAMRG
jgi:ATP-binding cassette, subfamily F, member 3